MELVAFHTLCVRVTKEERKSGADLCKFVESGRFGAFLLEIFKDAWGVRSDKSREINCTFFP